MRFRLPVTLPTAVLLALAACGGGGTSPSPNPPPAPPPPPPAPAPVATVTVTPGTAGLLPQQTQPLTAATLDAASAPLSGRTVTWSTSAGTVATVSNAGLVTALSAGTATITATSEGKNGTALITVADGGQVTTTGGTVDAAGGAVKITVPAGAVTAPVSITVTSNPAAPAGMPKFTYGVVGTHYTFGPEGTTFSAPLTVTVKYDPAKLPAWALPSDLAIYHFTGGAWVQLPGLVVDPVAHTLTATTTSFSPFTVGTRLPPAALSPSTGSVNFFQRSVTFDASIPGHTPIGLTYAWNGTGKNGAISPLGLGAVAQYTMTQAQLPPPPSTIDYVQVIIRGPIDPSQPTVIVPLASAEAEVNSNLKLSFSLSPDDAEPDFGGTQTLDAVIRDENGAIYVPQAGLGVRYVWTSSQLHGSLDIHDPANPTTVKRGVYTAKPASQSAMVPPRVDEITVDFYVQYSHEITDGSGVVLDTEILWPTQKNGSANAFLEVAPKVAIVTFVVRDIPSGSGGCVTADAKIPKVTGATSYDLTVTGIVGSSLGTTIHRTVTGITHLGNIMDVYDGGTFFGVPLDGGCLAVASRHTTYHSQYDHATFKAKSTP